MSAALPVTVIEPSEISCHRRPHLAPAPAGVRGRAQHRPPGTVPPPTLVGLLGILGRQVSEACTAGVQDLRYAGDYELLRRLGTGAKPAEIPLPNPVLRAVQAATDGRTHGPVLLSAKRRPADPGGGKPAAAPGRPERRA